MALSVYVHIPYCLQRCRYCDFTTFEWSEILPPEEYVQQVLTEIRQRRHLWPHDKIQTLYFGGGTPSLLAPDLILNITREFANSGFAFIDNAEVTIEINPATLTREKLEVYRRAGINRYSVGAQSFNDTLLKACGRKHTAQDTRDTLKLLKEYDLNYSFDLLFGLPNQSLADLERDLDEVANFAPPHLSAYCLTVPEAHPMNFGRPPEDEQVEMFALIESRLARDLGHYKYEISNFARPGFESRHNQAYWLDQPYWGVGLCAHSYNPQAGQGFGLRFWNPKSLALYGEQVQLATPTQWSEALPADQFEELQEHESLTDYCHMHLRTHQGLNLEALRNKYGAEVLAHVARRLALLSERGWIAATAQGFRLTAEGQLISNKVFEELTFFASELRLGRLTQPRANSYCAV